MEQTTRGSTLELSGSLDVRCIGEVRTAVYRLLDECDGDVYVNIAQVESVDMTTLKMLAVANRAAERAGQQVVLRVGRPGFDGCCTSPTCARCSRSSRAGSRATPEPATEETPGRLGVTHAAG